MKKFLILLLLGLLCIGGIVLCAQSSVSSDDIPEKYAVGVIQTIGNKESSDILYFNENLEQTGRTHYRYASMGDSWSAPANFGGFVYIVPQGLADRKDAEVILQLNLATLENQEFVLEQTAIYGVSADSSSLYAVSNLNRKSFVNRIDLVEKTVHTLEYSDVYVSTAYIFNDVLYAFSEEMGGDTQKETLHCINPDTMTEVKSIDISDFGSGVYSVVGVSTMLYFSVMTSPTGGFSNILGVYNTETDEITHIEFPQTVGHLVSYGDKLYVTHGNFVTLEGSSLSVYDMAAGTISTYDLGMWPGQLAVHGDSLYVLGIDQVAGYDLLTLELQAQIKIPLDTGYYLSGIFASGSS